MRYLIGLENHVTVQIKRYISHGINVIQLYSTSSEILKCLYQSMKKSTSANNGYKSKWFNIYDSNLWKKRETRTYDIKQSRRGCFRKVEKLLEIDVFCIIICCSVNKMLTAWMCGKYKRLFHQKTQNNMRMLYSQ